MPTDEEEAAIQRGIAEDADNPEWSDEMFARSRPAREMMPKAVYDELTAPRRVRGAGRKPAKVMTSLRLPPDVLARLEALPDWRKKAAEALARLVAADESTPSDTDDVRGRRKLRGGEPAVRQTGSTKA